MIKPIVLEQWFSPANRTDYRLVVLPNGDLRILLHCCSRDGWVTTIWHEGGGSNDPLNDLPLTPGAG